MSFDIIARNCLHKVNALLQQAGKQNLPELKGDPSNPLVRHRYGIELVKELEQATPLVSNGIVIMTQKNLFHHIGFADMGRIYSYEEQYQGWTNEVGLRQRGYQRFIYLEAK